MLGREVRMGRMLEKAMIIIDDGFEEMEALGTYDVLRRGGVDVQLVSVKENLRVKSSRGVIVEAVDILGNGTRFKDYDVLVIPGGPEYEKMSENENVLNFIADFDNAGKLIASICAGPVVLEKAGILEGRTGTCYPGFDQYLSYGKLQQNPVCIDGNLITSRGPATSIYFALTILEAMGKVAEAAIIRDDMLLGYMEYNIRHETFSLTKADVELIKAAQRTISKCYEAGAHMATAASGVMGGSGEIYTAVNIVMDHGISSEQAAISAALAAGETEITTVVTVKGQSGRHMVMPDGASRQTILETNPEAFVLVKAPDGVKKMKIADLLPQSVN